MLSRKTLQLRWPKWAPLAFFSVLAIAMFTTACKTEVETPTAQVLAHAPVNPLDSIYLDSLVRLTKQSFRSAPHRSDFLAREALKFCYEIDFPEGIANMHHHIGTANMYLSQFDTALYYFQESVDHKLALGLNTASKTYHNMGITASMAGDYEAAEAYLKSSIAEKEELDDARGLSLSYNMLGTVYDNQGRYENAIDAYLTSMSIYEEIGDTARIPMVVGNMAYTMRQLGRLDEAEEYLLRTLKWTRENDDPIGEKSMLVSIGSLLVEKDDFAAAVDTLEAARSIQERTGSLYSAANLYGALGASYYGLEKHQQSIEAYKQAKATSEQTGDALGRARAHLGLGANYRALDLHMQADAELRKAVMIGEEIGTPLVLQEAYMILAQVNVDIGNAELVMDYMEKHISAQDSMLDAEKNNKILALQAEYESVQKERELQTLRQQNEIVALQNRQQRVLIVVALALLVLLAGVTILYYRLSRLREKAASDKQLLMDEMHHRTKNNLAMLESLVRMQHRDVTAENAGLALQNTRNRVKAISLIHELLYRDEEQDGSIDMGIYLNRLTQFFKDWRSAAHVVELSNTLDNSRLAVDKAIPLSLICNELITNSMQHAFAEDEHGQVQVEINPYQEQGIELIVRDNGRGISRYPDKPGFGLRMVKGLAKQLGASLEFKNGVGTTTTLRIN